MVVKVLAVFHATFHVARGKSLLALDPGNITNTTHSRLDRVVEPPGVQKHVMRQHGMRQKLVTQQHSRQPGTQLLQLPRTFPELQEQMQSKEVRPSPPPRPTPADLLRGVVAKKIQAGKTTTRKFGSGTVLERQKPVVHDSSTIASVTNNAETRPSEAHGNHENLKPSEHTNVLVVNIPTPESFTPESLRVQEQGVTATPQGKGFRGSITKSGASAPGIGESNTAPSATPRNLKSVPVSESANMGEDFATPAPLHPPQNPFLERICNFVFPTVGGNHFENADRPQSTPGTARGTARGDIDGKSTDIDGHRLPAWRPSSVQQSSRPSSMWASLTSSNGNVFSMQQDIQGRPLSSRPVSSRPVSSRPGTCQTPSGSQIGEKWASLFQCRPGPGQTGPGQTGPPECKNSPREKKLACQRWGIPVQQPLSPEALHQLVTRHLPQASKDSNVPWSSNYSPTNSRKNSSDLSDHHNHSNNPIKPAGLAPLTPRTNERQKAAAAIKNAMHGNGRREHPDDTNRSTFQNNGENGSSRTTMLTGKDAIQLLKAHPMPPVPRPPPCSPSKAVVESLLSPKTQKLLADIRNQLAASGEEDVENLGRVLSGNAMPSVNTVGKLRFVSDSTNSGNFSGLTRCPVGGHWSDFLHDLESTQLPSIADYHPESSESPERGENDGPPPEAWWRDFLPALENSLAPMVLDSSSANEMENDEHGPRIDWQALAVARWEHDIAKFKKNPCSTSRQLPSLLTSLETGAGCTNEVSEVFKQALQEETVPPKVSSKKNSSEEQCPWGRSRPATASYTIDKHPFPHDRMTYGETTKDVLAAADAALNLQTENLPDSLESPRPHSVPHPPGYIPPPLSPWERSKASRNASKSQSPKIRRVKSKVQSVVNETTVQSPSSSFSNTTNTSAGTTSGLPTPETFRRLGDESGSALGANDEPAFKTAHPDPTAKLFSDATAAAKADIVSSSATLHLSNCSPINNAGMSPTPPIPIPPIPTTPISNIINKATLLPPVKARHNDDLKIEHGHQSSPHSDGHQISPRNELNPKHPASPVRTPPLVLRGE